MSGVRLMTVGISMACAGLVSRRGCRREGSLGPNFGTAHVVVVMQNLALEVGDLHHVVHDADLDGGGRAQAAGADYQDLGLMSLR